MANDIISTYLANRLKYHTASRFGIQQGKTFNQALQVDGHTVTTQKVWSAPLSGFPVNTGLNKTSIVIADVSPDLANVFKQGSPVSAAWYSAAGPSAGVVWTNPKYPNVRLFEDVIMTPTNGSMAYIDGKNVFESYEILQGVSVPDITAPILNKIRVKDFVSPLAVLDSSNGKPVPGYVARIKTAVSLTSQIKDIGQFENHPAQWADGSGCQFVYGPGIMSFARQITPIGVGYPVLRFTGFQYIGEYLDKTIDDLKEQSGSGITELSGKVNTISGNVNTISGNVNTISGNVNTISGKVTQLSGRVSAAFGPVDHVVFSKADGITSSQYIVGGATLAGTTLSTTLATQAAVRSAIDAKSISLVGHEAIKVSGDLDKTVWLNINSSDKILSQTIDGLKSDIQIKKFTFDPSSTIAAEYALVGKDGVSELGSRITVYKDQVLSGAYYDEDSKTLYLEIIVPSGTQVVPISLSGLVDVYDAGSGIVKLTDGVQHPTFVGKVDTSSEKHSGTSFLTVGKDGFKVNGIQTAIDDTVRPVSTFLSSAIKYVSGQVNTLETVTIPKITGDIKYISDEVDKKATITWVNNLSSVVSSIQIDYKANDEYLSGVISGGLKSLSGKVGQFDDAVSANTIFGKINRISANVGDTPVSQQIATGISNYNSTTVDPRFSKIESQLKGVASGDYAVRDLIEAASGNAYDLSKQYTTDQITGTIDPKITTISGQLKGFSTDEGSVLTTIEAASGNAYDLSKKYTDDKVAAISGTISGNFVTKDQFGVIASTDKATNIALSGEFEALTTQFEQLKTQIENTID